LSYIPHYFPEILPLLSIYCLLSINYYSRREEVHFKKTRRVLVIFVALFFLFSIKLPNTSSFFAQLKPVDIVVVEQPPTGKDKAGNPYDRDLDKNGKTATEDAYENYNTKKESLGIEHVLRASSVKNMVDAILGALKEDECIGTLKIVGHGCPGNISVGCGLSSDKDKEINCANEKEWKEEMKRLKDKFCPGASVYLKGCNVGACDDGAKKLQELADLLGVPVEAPTGLTYPDCSSEKGSETQRAEPAKKGEKKDPPKCILSPADQKKMEAGDSFGGILPFNPTMLKGLEIIPIGLEIPPIDKPETMLDIRPGEELFDQFLKAIHYDQPIKHEQDLLSNFNAEMVLHFEDGTSQKGMFHTDFDYFEFPYQAEDDSNYISLNYPSSDYDFERKLKQLCRDKMERFQPGFGITLSAEDECGYIQLRWNRVPGAERYYVYRGPGPGMEYPMPLTDFAITENSYQDRNDLVVGMVYCYYVRAVNAESKEFAQSNEVCVVMTCAEEIPPINEEDCRMTLKYQVDNKFYWKNDMQKGPMDAAPILREQRVNLMARYLAEEIGATVQWVPDTRTVIIIRPDGVEIRMQIGNPMATVGGVAVPIDPNNSSVVPFIEHNRTYTGLRFIAFNLGATGPDQIIWRAETKIAELIFHDPHCQWLCGSIRRIPSTPGTANYEEFGFFSAGQDAPDVPIRIPRELRDSIHDLTVAEYAQKFPNQNHWCAELRLGENQRVLAWRALAGKYPDCCGEKTKGRLRIYLPQGAQKDTVLNIFSVNGESVKRANEDWWVESFFDIACELPCPGKYKVVPVSPHGRFMPESQEVDIKCCPAMNEVEFDFKPN
jgi:hypothetical protein